MTGPPRVVGSIIIFGCTLHVAGSTLGLIDPARDVFSFTPLGAYWNIMGRLNYFASFAIVCNVLGILVTGLAG